jgi:hypothetical protein
MTRKHFSGAVNKFTRQVFFSFSVYNGLSVGWETKLAGSVCQNINIHTGHDREYFSFLDRVVYIGPKQPAPKYNYYGLLNSRRYSENSRNGKQNTTFSKKSVIKSKNPITSFSILHVWRNS